MKLSKLIKLITVFSLCMISITQVHGTTIVEDDEILEEYVDYFDDEKEDIPEAEIPFTDVPENKWYYSYICEIYRLGIMTGKNETTFGPSDHITRGQLATILYRMAGKAKIEYSPVFSDVPESKFYSIPVVWAKSVDVVKGYIDGTFKPSQDITRQELAIMLRNYASYCGKDVTANTAILNSYPDYKNVSGYAQEAMAWAVENKLITGDQGNLNPKNTATRAQTAKMIIVLNGLLAD